MPENESLVHDDPRTASRWQPIAERIDSGQSPSELFPVIQVEFYRALGKAWKRWNERGVDAAQLFEAALSDPTLQRQLVKQTLFDSNARLLCDVAMRRPDANMEYLIHEFINAAWESVVSQLQLDRHESAQSLEFEGQVQRMLSHIIRGLVKNPSRFPKRPSRNEPPPDLDTQLRQSLL